MSESDVILEEYDPRHAPTWKAFLAASSNGTLFHDLDFLAYHAPARFQTRHLLFLQNGRPIALLPGAVVAQDAGFLYQSPCGASVGGIVLPARPTIQSTLDLLGALQNYAQSHQWNAIEMRLGPAIYGEPVNDVLAFALASSGYRLVQRWFSPVITLPTSSADGLANLPTKRRLRYIRAAHRQGLAFRQAASESLPAFYEVLLANRAKHAAVPTHSLEELQRIFQLVPAQVRLFVCDWNGQVASGCVVFELNPCVAYTFYLAHDDHFDELYADMVTLHGVVEHYVNRGFRYLELGPSGHVMLPNGAAVLNSGVIRFKEEMGAVGVCRDTWRWG